MRPGAQGERPRILAPVLRPADDPDALDEAAVALEEGRAVVLPTDTVYGLAASPAVPGATEQLFALKARSERQPLAVLVADEAQARTLWAEVPVAVGRLLGRAWPGPLTVVLARSASARGYDLGGDGETVGVRYPDHPAVQALARRVGPLAVTSANRSGEPTPTTAGAAAASLTDDVTLVLDGGELSGAPSTVVDCRTDPWTVLREGPITLGDLRRMSC